MPQIAQEYAIKVVDHVDAMLAYWDRDLRCRFANAAYRVWFGKGRDELIGLHMKELLGPLYEMNLPYIEGALRGEEQTFERDITLPDGSVRHSLACYFPDLVDGQVMGFCVQVADVSRLKELELELKAAKAKAEALATHDFLTGLPNRVLLLDRISSAIHQAARTGRSVAVVAIDLDNFKSINDSYGHECGDAVLKEVAERMKAAIRGTDTISRIGGDEFILMASEAGTELQLRLVLDRMYQIVCVPIQRGEVTLIPNLSCGVAVYPTDGLSANELMISADRALYQAKREGKNRFAFRESSGAGADPRPGDGA